MWAAPGGVATADAQTTAAGWSVADVAIAWTLRRPEVTSAIVGARGPEQIEQTVSAGDRVLDAASISAVFEMIEERDRQLTAIGGAAKPRV